MTIKKLTKDQIPLILYEEPSSRNDDPIPFPYIEVAKEGQMPPVLFIFEYKHTGEVEPDSNGQEAAIVDQIPHKYVDMEYLKEHLPTEVNDKVRVALGLQPLDVAKAAGRPILEKIMGKVGELSDQAKAERDRKLEEAQEKEKGN